ncbi:MAG: hypothetical protein P8J20_10815 [Novosphingobium sp.]|nr:hypothetical protein [Novosphingobium sp.]
MKRFTGLAAIAALLALATTTAVSAESTEGVMSRSEIKGDPVAICGHLAYVTNSYSKTLSVIDLETHSLVENHKTGNAPVNPTFSHDWKKLYFSNVDDGTLSIVDSKTSRIVDTIPAGGAHPSGLRFLPDGKHLIISYIGDTHTEPGALGKMELTSGKMIWKIPVEAQSERFDITPDGSRAYVANLIGKTISVVDLDAGKIIATIASPEPYPFNVLVSPNGKRAFVGNTMGSTILEIDTASNEVTKTIKTAPGPNGMSFTPDGYNILITTVYGGMLQSYNITAGVLNEGSFVGLLPGFIRLAPDGLKGIFVRPYGRQVSVFDGTTMQIIENIETGIGPTTVAICGNP